jgi:hypothetical protein
MITNHYIFDDILNKEEQKILYDYVKTDDIKWEFLENIRNDYKITKIYLPAKVHPQPYCKDEKIKELIDTIQLKISEKLDLKFVQNYRWKINCLQPLDHIYNPLDLLHYDRIDEHIAVIYYINDATGDTCIYTHKETDTADKYVNNFIDASKYSLITKVSPKMGRCFVFNGKLAHHANYPTNGDRYIINFNFVAKNKKEKSLL